MQSAGAGLGQQKVHGFGLSGGHRCIHAYTT